MSAVSRLLIMLCSTVLAAGALSGCVTTTAGTAVQAGKGAPTRTDVPTLQKSDLDRVMLSVGVINGIMDTTGIRVGNTMEEMSDNSDAVSNRDCLGAIYGAEEKVYDGSDWTAVRDQVLQEPTSDNDHWVEQIAVLYPSPEKAQKFVDDSRTLWQRCSKKTIDVDTGDNLAQWDMEDADVSGAVLTQTSTQRDADGWGCQHALTSAANLVVEAWACSDSIGGEAHSIVDEMLKNAAKK